MPLVINEKIKLPGISIENSKLNRLLKLIEELSGYSVIFLISDSFSRQKNLYKELSGGLSKSIKLIELKNSSNLIEVLSSESSNSDPTEAFYILGLDLLLEDLNPEKKEETINILENQLDDFIELNRPVIFTLPISLVAELKENAPDFWKWHQGIFLFEEKFEYEHLQLHFICDQFINIFGLETYQRKKGLLILFEDLVKELSQSEENLLTYLNYLGNLTLLYYEIGDYQTALNYVFQQREEIEKLNNELALIFMWNNIGQIHQNLGQYNQAKGIYKRILKKYKKIFKEQYVYRALVQNNIGYLDHLMGDDNEALRHCHHALGTIENNFNPLETHLAPVLNVLGRVYLNLHNEEDALDCYRRILQICEKNERLDHPYIALIMHQIGKVYWHQKDYEMALNYFYKWIEKMEWYFGPEHPDLAIIVCNVGEVYFEKEIYSKALSYFKWALQIREKAFAHHEDPDSAKILYFIGKAKIKLNEMEEGKDYLDAAKEIWEKRLEPNHPFIKEYKSEIENIEQKPQTEEQKQSAH